MKFAVLAAAAFACLTPAAAFAQTAPVQTAPAQTAPAAKFNLDTPLQDLVADAQAKAILDADLGADITQSPQYEMGKTYSLNQVASYKPEFFTPEALKKIETDLAALK